MAIVESVSETKTRDVPARSRRRWALGVTAALLAVALSVAGWTAADSAFESRDQACSGDGCPKAAGNAGAPLGEGPLLDGFSSSSTPLDGDGDGCADASELGANAAQGGRRDPANVWDFFDTPATSALVRDRAIGTGDIAAIVLRFGASDRGPGAFDRNSDPLSTPGLPVAPSGSRANYHPAFDRRGSIAGQDPWDLRPPDGSVGAAEVAAVVTQFGHSCLTTGQPAAPIQAAFFYPWFPAAWSQSGVDPYTNYTPSLGRYDSRNAAVIDDQLRLAKRAHLEAFIASWWGPGHHTDDALQTIIDRSARAGSPHPDLRWAVYYEQESQGDPTVAQLVFDLQYLADTFFGHPGYLRVDGRPVVFVYPDALDGAGMAGRWAQAKAQLGGKLYLVLKVYTGYRTDPNQPDSWHQYAPAAAFDDQSPYSVTVSPGFWKVGETPRLARDPARFEADVQRMAASGAFWQLVTSWNEWGEGTSVEPAQQFRESYVDILCRKWPGAVSCGDPVLVGAGDIASCDGAGDEATAQLLDGIFSGGAYGLVFTTGDNVYDSGTAGEFTNCYQPSWGRHLGRTKPSAGNHEYQTSGAAGYFGYFGAAAGDPAKGYYSYDIGAWHVVVLNSNCGDIAGGCAAGSPQEQWLRADLAAHPAACTLAYWHHPRFSSGSTHGSHASMQPIWQALYDYNADAVVAGHEHQYERFAPQTASGALDLARGIRLFVAGMGGRSHYGFGTIRPNSEVRNGDSDGVLKLTLHPTSYDWQFVPAASGTFTDVGTSACH